MWRATSIERPPGAPAVAGGGRPGCGDADRPRTRGGPGVRPVRAACGTAVDGSPTMNRAQGFTLVELLLALSLTIVVVGAAVTVTGEVQRTQACALEDTAAQQEARYAI